jgi:hypothetical protein
MNISSGQNLFNVANKTQKRNASVNNKTEDITCFSFKAGKINYDKFVTAMYQMIANSDKKIAGAYAMAYPEEFFLALCKIINEMTERQKIYSGKKPIDLKSLKQIKSNAAITLEEDKLENYLKFAQNRLYLVPDHIIQKNHEALKLLPTELAKPFRKEISHQKAFETKKTSTAEILLFLKKNHLNQTNIEEFKRALIKSDPYEPLITILSDTKIKDKKINTFCRDALFEIIDNSLNDFEKLKKINSELAVSQENLTDIIWDSFSYDKEHKQMVIDKLGMITNLYRYLDLKIETIAQESGRIKI